MRETTITKIRDDYFRVVYYPDEFATAKDRISRYFHSEKEANDFANEIDSKKKKDQTEEQKPVDVKKKDTIGSLLYIHVEEMEGSRKATTIHKIKDDLTRHLVKGRKYMPINDFLKWDYMKEVRKSIKKKKWKIDTKNHLFSHIVQMFESAKLNDKISEEQFHLVQRAFKPLLDDEKKSDKKQKYFWEPEDTRKFLLSLKCKHTKWYVLFAFQLFAGLRVGEIRALRLEDYDPEKKIIYINKQAVFLDGKTQITTPKTKSSNRPIKLTDKMNNFIQEYIKEFRIHDPKAFLFFNQDYPVSSTTINRKLEEYRKEFGLSYASFHTLRHISETYAFSQPNLQLPDLAQLAERYGHTLAVALDMYYHIRAEMNDTLTKALDDIVPW